MSMPPAPETPARLTPAVILFAASLICWLIFTFGFANAPKLPTDSVCGTVTSTSNDAISLNNTAIRHAHGHTDATSVGNETFYGAPNYFAGGLWSDQLGLAALSELAVALKAGNQPVAAYSLSWDNHQLIVRDVSPITMTTASESTPETLVVSIDHSGPDPSPEFGNAIQDYVRQLAELSRVIVLPPLPGKDKVPDIDFPYDWYYLAINDKVQIVDWALIEPNRDVVGYAQSGYLMAWLDEEDEATAKVQHRGTTELLQDLDTTIESGRRAAIWREIIERGPYQVVPILRQWAKGLNPIPDPILLSYRLLGVHADDLIEKNINSKGPGRHLARAAAARAIGDLADVTDDPIGKLTLLAEDQEMAVRSEAFYACAKIGGRAAAGVAQLVGDYEMSEQLRINFQAIMPDLLAAGDPIQPDSRAARLRRTTLPELLKKERDALVCKILLENTNLPDSQASTIIEQLGKAKKEDPLLSLLDLLESMNPTALSNRGILLKILANWEAKQINQFSERIAELTAAEHKPEQLRAVAAAALLRAPQTRAGLINAYNNKPIIFKGLAWLEDVEALKTIAPLTWSVALGEISSTTKQTQIAAIDALQYLPESTIGVGRVAAILNLARTANDVDIRFAAIAAVNDLPDSLKPASVDDFMLTRLTVRSVPGRLAFDLKDLIVIAGRPVELTLINPDTMPHNLVITSGGRAQAVGKFVTDLGPTKSAAIKYVPDSPDVLFATAMVPAGGSDTLRFIAPVKPGKYDYVCTFPGHFTTMVGTLRVVAP